MISTPFCSESVPARTLALKKEGASVAVRFCLSTILVTFLTSMVAAQSPAAKKDIPAIARAANGSIVSIVMSDKDGKPLAQGSGFFVSKDGLVVTNYHVIAEGSSAVVKLPDGAFYAVDGVVASDKARDIAIIKAHGQNFRMLTLGNSDRVQVGEEVVAIGSPLSLESTVSNGIVSGIRSAEDLGGKFLQITTPISHGSSGGPLFNMMGEVIGITSMYLKGGENLNFAIPINDAKQLLRSDSSRVQSFPNEPERPALSAESPPKPATHDGDASSARKRTMCITEVATNTGSRTQPVQPCQFFASLPVSLSPGDHGINGKVCILDVMTHPNGQPEAIPPCLIVASLPFSFSKEDVSIYDGMLIAEGNGMTFMNAETLYPNTANSEKSLIASAVKAFREQRKLFCSRHPEMAIFNLDDAFGGPEFSETGPQSCTDTTSTAKNGLSHVEVNSSPDHQCRELAAKVTLDKRTSYYPDEPRIEYKSYYDPRSAKCYVESGLYWDNGKKYPPNKTSTGLVTVENDGTLYANIVLGPNSTILGCALYSAQGLDQHCNSKEQFEDLVSKTFGILPPNTKVSASLPYPNSASEDQIVEDLRYCHENPNHNLQVAGSTLISCKDATAVIEEQRIKPCKAGKQSKVMKRMCKDLLNATKEYRGR